jgi:hypothetical protein
MRTERGSLMQIPFDSVQEYEVPPSVIAVRIEAQSSGARRHSSSTVTLQISPGAILRLRLVCLPAQPSSEAPSFRDPQSDMR